MNELIHPNWHVILIHYPLGLLTLGIVVELFSFLWKRSTIVAAGRWMILLGALLSLPALATGLYAFVVESGRWGDPQKLFMKLHWLLMCSSAGLFLAAVVAWIACSDHWRQRLHWIFLAAFVIGMGGMAVGAWYAGEGVYRYAVAVSPQATPSTAPARAPESQNQLMLAQVHLLLVGLTAALVLAALSLTIRRWTVGPRAMAEEPAGDIETHLIEPPASQEPGENLPGIQRHEFGGPSALAEPPRIFAARWWMRAALLAVLTATAGLWTTEAMKPKPWMLDETRELVGKAFSREGRAGLNADETRMLIHVILGACIILLPLILALITRFSKRLMWTTIIGLALLSAAVGVQVWKGVQLLYNL